MTIYKSQQINLDKEPYLFQGHRYRADQVEGIRRNNSQRNDPAHVVWAPRPEFEPTRDPKPWLCDYEVDGHPVRSFFDGHGRYTWAPRREQFDTPVNRVLSGVREDWQESNDLGHDLRAHALMWLSTEDDWEVTPEEAHHARRVLTRLANWKEQ